MAKYDHGGGCPCWLYAECDPECKHYNTTLVDIGAGPQPDFSSTTAKIAAMRVWPVCGDCKTPDDCRGAMECADIDKGLGKPFPAPPINPKTLVGDKKLPLYLVPFSFVAHVCLALYDGMRKYGLVNWRAAPVEAMTYVSAMERHVKKWTNGQKLDPVSKVHHLAHAAACCCILLDAEAHGSLIDNRPMPNAGMDALVSDLEATLVHLKAMHADRAEPKHHTIADAQKEP